VDVVRVIIVRLKFAARRADVMGVPKLPEAYDSDLVSGRI
jgi:hypothetical protein